LALSAENRLDQASDRKIASNCALEMLRHHIIKITPLSKRMLYENAIKPAYLSSSWYLIEE